MVTRPPQIVPSLLAGDHAHLADGEAVVAKLGLPWIHLDIMDGHFVPNLSFGPELLAALRRGGSRLFFDTHLMLSEPDRYVDAFARAGANLITVHIEPDYDHAATLGRIRALGCRRGIALNPGTPAGAVEPILSQVDLVLAMTVQPGFGGQAFHAEVLPKIGQLAAWRRERALDFAIEVDGGIDLDSAPRCRAAGADHFVVGTAFFHAADRAAFARGIDSMA